MVNTTTAKLKPHAYEQLDQIMGDEAAQFQLMNNEYEYVSKGPGNENEYLLSITYRFVRVKDGLPIVGNTNHIKITFNSKGNLSRFTVKDYVLEKAGKVKRKVKNARLEKYLTKELKRPYLAKMPNGEDIKFTNIEVVECIESYLPVEYKKQKVLLPHAYFKVKSQIESGEVVNAKVYLSLDAEFSENVDPEDVIELEKPDKY